MQISDGQMNLMYVNQNCDFSVPTFFTMRKKQNNLQLPMLYFYRSFPKQNEINPRNTKIGKTGFWINRPIKAQYRDLVDLFIAT